MACQPASACSTAGSFLFRFEHLGLNGFTLVTANLEDTSLGQASAQKQLSSTFTMLNSALTSAPPTPDVRYHTAAVSPALRIYFIQKISAHIFHGFRLKSVLLSPHALRLTHNLPEQSQGVCRSPPEGTFNHTWVFHTPQISLNRPFPVV